MELSQSGAVHPMFRSLLLHLMTSTSRSRTRVASAAALTTVGRVAWIVTPCSSARLVQACSFISVAMTLFSACISMAVERALTLRRVESGRHHPRRRDCQADMSNTRIEPPNKSLQRL